jgi:hypothetical protein
MQQHVTLGQIIQIMETVPSAMSIAADSLGVSPAELRKMLEEGKIVKDEFFPEFLARCATVRLEELRSQENDRWSSLSGYRIDRAS